MADASVSDLPSGFVLDSAPTPAALPSGFVLDNQQQSAPITGEVPVEPARSVMDQLTGVGGPRYQTFPERMARDIYSRAQNAFTAPERAYSEGLSPDEEVKAAADTALTFGPMTANPMVASGDAAIPTAANVATDAGASSGMQAAQTAIDLGAPLPVGLASDNRAMQAATQAARQLPVVGQKIDTQAAKTISAAGEGVQSLADQLSGGVTDRAATGAILRPSLQGVIDDNNEKIGDAFSSLRGMIDQSEPTDLPYTENVLNDIVKQRTAAGQRNPISGLEDVQNLVDQGATFDGLQRARNDIGNSLDFGQANPGFNKGDLKRIYGAMSADMDNVVRQSALPGVSPDTASQALSEANATAAPLFGFNKSLQRLLNIKNDEGMVGSVINAAQGQTGNLKLLAQLRATMPPEDFQQVAGTALNELGHNSSTGHFSLSQFATKWDKLGDRAKSVFFEPQHKQFLDNIAQLGRHLKDADQYRNTSNTGRSVVTADIAARLGSGALHALMLNFGPLLDALGSIGGGYALGSFLSRPAGAATMARWSRAIMAQSQAPSPARMAGVTMMTRNLISNMSDSLGIPSGQLVRQLQAPMRSDANQQQPTQQRLPAQ